MKALVDVHSRTRPCLATIWPQFNSLNSWEIQSSQTPSFVLQPSLVFTYPVFLSGLWLLTSTFLFIFHNPLLRQLYQILPYPSGHPGSISGSLLMPRIQTWGSGTEANSKDNHETNIKYSFNTFPKNVSYWNSYIPQFLGQAELTEVIAMEAVILLNSVVTWHPGA